MEKELFDWEDVDWVTDSALQFTNCRLKVGLGNFKIDMVVPMIVLDFENGEMTLHETDGAEISKHKLGLTIKV